MADIELVIKIPEENYKKDNLIHFFGCYSEKLDEVIKKGTPLPKGHGRLIEVTNQLEQELFTFQRYTGIDEAPYESATIITDRAPTIIDADKAGKEEHIKSFFNADEKNGARYYLIDLKSTVRLHKDFKGDRWDRALDLVLKKIDERLGEI